MRKSTRLIRYAGAFENPDSAIPFSRPFLAVLLSESGMVEERLDHYGAAASQEWYPLRELTSAIKNFSRAAYVVLHVYYRIPAMHIENTAELFLTETGEVIEILTNILRKACGRFMAAARRCRIVGKMEPVNPDDLIDETVPGHFPHDLAGESTANAEEDAVKLATEYLNLSASFQQYSPAESIDNSAASQFFTDVVSEEEIRIMELRSHNLQSLYDTYLQATPTENLNLDLVRIRGHISIIFHLLEVTTIVTHFYIRHLHRKISITGADREQIEMCTTRDDLLKIIVMFGIRVSMRYLKNGAEVCRTVLKRYVKVVTRNIPIPHYRGFHVRPSTLVAKIVKHYGSDVSMTLEGETYDAGFTLDLFRANEAINRMKRKQLAAQLEAVAGKDSNQTINENIKRSFRQILNLLAAQGTIIIYDENAFESADSPVPEQPATLRDFSIDSITRLHALGKLDICISFSASFTGDERVLKDIQLLAENGYGEDKFGHNIPLPVELPYLHRSKIE